MKSNDFRIIKSKERVKKYGEVFTPPDVVNHMLDLLQETNEDDCFLPDKTFLEPSCGTGAFILEVLKRKFKHCKIHKDFEIAISSVYGFEIQKDNVEECIENVITLCKEHFKVTKNDVEIIKNHIILCDGLKVMRMINDFNERESR